jgi:hypothetical protein
MRHFWVCTDGNRHEEESTKEGNEWIWRENTNRGWYQVTKDEFYGIGFLAHLAKPTTGLACMEFEIRAHYLFASDATLTERYLRTTRDIAIKNDSGEVSGESACDVTGSKWVAPQKIAGSVVDLLYEDQLRSARGILPPLQQAQLDRMMAKRGAYELALRDRNALMAIESGPTHYWSEFDQQRYMECTSVKARK